MICLRNKNHVKTETVCVECLKTINEFACEPQLQDVEPELRALFKQLTLQNKDLHTCWKSSHKTITVLDKRLNIENVYYCFYKADIGNFALKRICGTIGCVNPAHHKSRFEVETIKTKVRSGFNRKLKTKDELSTAEWLRQP
jgi:hypothetical protein